MILVIGYGNPIRGDDAVGWRVAEALAAPPSTVEVLRVHQLTPEMAEDISRAEAVIFLDARQASIPGNVSCDQILPHSDDSALGHFLSAEILLTYALKLYGQCPPAFLVSVGAEQFEVGSDLSSVVKEAIPVAVRRVKELIGKLNAGQGTG